ncbi:MAG: hypothetical protein ABR521_10080 [Gaiellaceae bacterium]
MLFRMTRSGGVARVRCAGLLVGRLIEFEGVVRGEQVRGAAEMCDDQVGFDMWQRTLPPQG